MEIKFQGTHVSIDVKFITVLYGSGKFQDNQGEVYNIYNIKLPTFPDGKHITVYDNDDNEVVVNMSYDDGKILSFTCERVEHWDIQ